MTASRARWTTRASTNSTALSPSGPDDRIGIVTSGKTYLDLREASHCTRTRRHDLRRYGIRILKLGMIYPVDPQIVHRFADGLDEIIVVEEKRAFIETAVRDILYRRANAPRVSRQDRSQRQAPGQCLRRTRRRPDRQCPGPPPRRRVRHRTGPAWSERPRTSTDRAAAAEPHPLIPGRAIESCRPVQESRVCRLFARRLRSTRSRTVSVSL